MSEDYPKVQVSSFITGDQWVFRGEDGESLKKTVESVAENADDTIKALNGIKQVGVASGIFTGDSSKGGNRQGGGERKQDAPPPSGDTPTCSHGPMKDLSGRGYKNRWYCQAKNRDEQCKPRP